MTYKPYFNTTPHLLKILEEVASLHAHIQGATVGVRWIPTLQKEASVRLAHGSTAIEGNPLTLAEVKILADGGMLPHAASRSVQEILNYLAALRYLDERAKAESIAEKDICHLHGIIGQKDALDRGPIGAYRTYEVHVGNHVTPPHNKVPALMKELVEWVNGPGKDWPAVISSAVLHYRFEHVHPFGDGNGRVGRLLATWELFRRHFDTHHIFAVDEILLEDRQGYYRAFQRAQAVSHDLTGWVEYIAETVNETLRRVWKRMEAVKSSVRGKPIVLTPKQEKLIQLLQQSPMGIGEIQKALHVTKPGAHHILKPLLEADLVKREGGHKTGKYRLTG